LRRVVIGEFGDIPAMALRQLLEQEEGLVVAGEAPAAEIIPLVGEIQPDVLLLDHDHPATRDIAADVSARLPAVTVIAWSVDEPLMQVFPARHGGEFHVSPLTTELLTAALKGVMPQASLVGLASLSRWNAVPPGLHRCFLEATYERQNARLIRARARRIRERAALQVTISQSLRSSIAARRADGRPTGPARPPEAG
jgi:hypothetical protein